MLRNKITRSGANTIGGEVVYVEDVFSTYVYDATRDGDTGQKITNGINLLSNTGKSLEISASNYISYGRIPAADFGTNNWTMEMFLRCSSLYTSSAGQIVSLIMKDDVSTRSFQWRWYQNKFEFLYWNTSGILSIVNFGTYGSFPLNQWLHVRLCKSGSTLYMYVDGTRIGTASITDIRSGNDPLTVGCYLGGGSGDKSYNIGYVSNVRIVNGSALSTGTSFTVPTTPLTKVNNTSLLMAQYPDPFLDSSNNNYAISDGNSLLGSLNPPITLPTDDVPLGEGLVWIKNRDNPDDHKLIDTVRGANKELESSTTGSETLNPNGLTAFHADGFSVGSDNEYHTTNEGYVSWTFKKQPGFFDVVTYTANGGTSQTIPHNLGSVPGCIIIKRLDFNSGWAVYHRGVAVDPETDYLLLNSSDAAVDATGYWNDTPPTDSTFTIGGNGDVNKEAGATYVAYLFAHDAQEFGPNGNESIIKCGSIAADASGNASVDLGWEPQLFIYKRSDGIGAWNILDNIRGIVSGGNESFLAADTADAEATTANRFRLTAVGLESEGSIGANFNYIYIAIRRPHKPASEFAATDLFAVDLSGPGSAPAHTSGFPVDMAWHKDWNSSGNHWTTARLIQADVVATNLDDPAVTSSGYVFDFMDGWYNGSLPFDFYSYMFRRAPGFFDVVCYKGDGVAGRTVRHNLGVVPEMVWIKNLDSAFSWPVYSPDVDITKTLLLNNSAQPLALDMWNSTAPSATDFTLSSAGAGNQNGSSFVAFLFASVPGICDIGSYTGNGTSQTIDCGFTGGARFVLTRRIDTTSGDWGYFDTVRGIVAGNDSRLELNESLAANTGYDFIDPDSSGFTINSAGAGPADDPNESGVPYIYMAIA